MARPKFLEVFNSPKDILTVDSTHISSSASLVVTGVQEPPIQHPVDSFSFGWLDGISISEGTSLVLRDVSCSSTGLRDHQPYIHFVLCPYKNQVRASPYSAMALSQTERVRCYWTSQGGFEQAGYMAILGERYISLDVFKRNSGLGFFWSELGTS